VRQKSTVTRLKARKVSIPSSSAGFPLSPNILNGCASAKGDRWIMDRHSADSKHLDEGERGQGGLSQASTRVNRFDLRPRIPLQQQAHELAIADT